VETEHGHESFWHLSRVCEEGTYHLLRVTNWHPVHCQPQVLFYGFISVTNRELQQTESIFSRKSDVGTPRLWQNQVSHRGKGKRSSWERVWIWLMKTVGLQVNMCVSFSPDSIVIIWWQKGGHWLWQSEDSDLVQLSFGKSSVYEELIVQVSSYLRRWQCLISKVVIPMSWQDNLSSLRRWLNLSRFSRLKLKFIILRLPSSWWCSFLDT
jgi:hypothetical protein